MEYFGSFLNAVGGVLAKLIVYFVERHFPLPAKPKPKKKRTANRPKVLKRVPITALSQAPKKKGKPKKAHP